MLENAGEELGRGRADAIGALRIVAQRLAGLVPQAHMDMEPVADAVVATRRECHRMAEAHRRRPRHLAHHDRLVAGDERLLGRKGHLELVMRELGEMAVGLDAALVERRETSPKLPWRRTASSAYMWPSRPLPPE